MRRTSRKFAVLVHTALFFLAAVLGNQAFASSAGPLPPETMVVTPGGVDLRSGVLKVSKTLLSIGDGQIGALDFRRIPRTYGYGELGGKMGQFNHNWDIRFRRKNRVGGGNGADVIVTSDELSFTFFDDGSGGILTTTSATGYATLVRTTVGTDFYYTMTTADGTTINSRQFAGGAIALASSITKSNGISYTLSYDGSGLLHSVVSNAGYALLFEYVPNTSLVNKVCALNLTTMLLPSSCPTGASRVAYGYSGQLATSETDASNAVWPFTSTYTNSSTAFTETYSLPGASAPYLSVNYDYVDFYQFAVTDQMFADGRHFTYGWGLIDKSQAGDDPMALVASYYTEDTSASVTFDGYRYDVFAPPRLTPGPSVFANADGTTLFDYCLDTCSIAALRSKTMPSGMKASYTYDPYRNLTQTSVAPISGSPLPPIVTNATYDCSTMIYCNKPTQQIDANRNATDYIYSPVHGQMLTKTLPAVGGVRPQTRYSYTQRYAWISNGSGYIHAASPIWLVTGESTCRSGAAASSGIGCSIAGDEVKITYDYGPDSGPNSLLLRGKLIEADGLLRRTCYGYDGLGRKISETAPRAGLAVCP